jgi:hypothetical protein
MQQIPLHRSDTTGDAIIAKSLSQKKYLNIFLKNEHSLQQHNILAQLYLMVTDFYSSVYE